MRGRRPHPGEALGRATPVIVGRAWVDDARAQVRRRYTDRQQGFLDFVLAQYTKEGVGELDADKLAPLLRLKYKAITDATLELGEPAQIRDLFIGFQRYLYEPTAGLAPAP